MNNEVQEYYLLPEIRSSGSMCRMRNRSNCCRPWRVKKRGRYTHTHTRTHTHTHSHTHREREREQTHMYVQVFSAACAKHFLMNSQEIIHLRVYVGGGLTVTSASETVRNSLLHSFIQKIIQTLTPLFFYPVY